MNGLVMSLCGAICGANGWDAVENDLNWTIDVASDEDSRRIRDERVAENTRWCRASR
jgi:hypothetical protein